MYNLIKKYAGETIMTDIKRQVLTRLYALRGSISYLSQEVKGFTQKEELAAKALEEIEDKYCEEKYGYKKLYVAHRMLDVCNTIQREREIKGLPPLSDSDLVDEGMARYEREHGIYDVEAGKGVTITADGGVITVSGAGVARVEVYTADGLCVYSGTGNTISNLVHGIYIVKAVYADGRTQTLKILPHKNTYTQILQKQ